MKKRVTKYVIEQANTESYYSEARPSDDFFNDIGLARQYDTYDSAIDRLNELNDIDGMPKDLEVKILDIIYEVNKLHLEKEKMAPDLASKWYVYFIREKDDYFGHYKIGYTCNLHARIKNLQTGSSAFLGYEGYFEFNDETSAYNYERSLHEKFDKLRIGGEWFNGNDGVIEAFINSCHQNRITNFIRYLT